MTEIATIDWFGKWGKYVFSKNTATFLYHFHGLLSESELLLVTRSNDNHSPGPVMREVSP